MAWLMTDSLARFCEFGYKDNRDILQHGDEFRTC